MLVAPRRASSIVSTLACIASISVARPYTNAIDWRAPGRGEAA
jgi:hypothetical protein